MLCPIYFDSITILFVVFVLPWASSQSNVGLPFKCHQMGNGLCPCPMFRVFPPNMFLPTTNLILCLLSLQNPIIRPINRIRSQLSGVAVSFLLFFRDFWSALVRGLGGTFLGRAWFLFFFEIRGFRFVKIEVIYGLWKTGPLDQTIRWWEINRMLMGWASG